MRLLPPPKPKSVSKWAQLATALGHGGDAASTIYGLNQDGVEEKHPLYGNHPSAAKILGIKGSTAALQMLFQHWAGKRNPKAANIAGFSTGAALGALTASNIHQANKSKK